MILENDYQRLKEYSVKESVKESEICCYYQKIFTLIICLLINLLIILLITFFINPYLPFYNEYTKENHELNNIYITSNNKTNIYSINLNFTICYIDCYDTSNYTELMIVGNKYIPNIHSYYTLWIKDNNCYLDIPININYSILYFIIFIFVSTFLFFSLLKIQYILYNKFCIKKTIDYDIQLK